MACTLVTTDKDGNQIREPWGQVSVDEQMARAMRILRQRREPPPPPDAGMGTGSWFYSVG